MQDSMLSLAIYLLTITTLRFTTSASDDAYANEIRAWQTTREKKLTAENGWLALAGRFPLKAGWNTIGTGAANDVVLPKEPKGTGPEPIGAVIVDDAAKKVTLKLAGGVSIASEGKP